MIRAAAGRRVIGPEGPYDPSAQEEKKGRRGRLSKDKRPLRF